ncbi:hypothetical protein B484DRAFT_447675 [Ochromonadaceae sp. CCMP2298]|nr:hypothetical protein B484DRAFT_447675 [Ochromonadaceae sp. CCMP2298]
MPTMKRTPSRHHARPKSSMGSSLVLCFFVCCLMVMGLLLQLVLAPQGAGGPSTNSILSIPTASTLTLSQKIAKLVPRFTEKADGTDGIDEDLAVPPYEKEFWSPIDVLDVSNTPIVVLCKLNFKKYSQAPHLSPMFKDLVGNSDCKGGNRRRENLRQQVDEIRNNPQLESNRVVEPSGFVFHESRVGSTLMANFLASNPYAMVFSESQPMANAILHCESCSREYNIQLFRDVTRLMGRSPFHTHLFFKFQSITVTQMGIALEAFPEVPWVFLYREPAQTMMSHMDPLKNNNGNAPCMRSKRHPPQDVKDSIARHASGSTPNEAWCAAHLNMLCTHAIRNLEKWGSYLDRNGSVQGVLRQRGLIINYDSMPGIVPKAILPHFGVHPVPSYWLRKISQESQMYSKSRGSKKHTFQSDSEDKSTRATEQINKYADLILGPTYELLQRKGGEALRRARPGLFVGGDGGAVKWKEFSPLPPLDGAGAGTGAGVGVGAGTGASGGGQGVVAGVLARFNANVGDLHSHIDKQTEFKAWAPFANHHSSVSKHPAECPIHPSANYPKSFSMLDISHNWNPDNTDIPPTHYDTLCHFDYTNATQLRSAYNYRTAEKPFVAYNIPEIDAVAKKWSDIDYLSKKLGHKAYRTETSISNHFMYWRNAKGKFLRTEEGKGWTPPTNIVKNTFDEWVKAYSSPISLLHMLIICIFPPSQICIYPT